MKKKFIKNILLFLFVIGILYVYNVRHATVSVAATAPNSEKNNDKGVPVLMYHCISENKNDAMHVSRDLFENQMRYLKDSGYATLSMDELYDFIKNDKPVPERSVVITFDDGYEDNYTNAYPILKKNNFKATIFVISDLCKQGGLYLNADQMKELEQNGIQIGSHTQKHDKLDKLSYNEQMDTLVASKEWIEKNLHKECKYIAYPFGKHNKDTLRAVKEAGYDMAFTTEGKWAYGTDDAYEMHRIFINGLQTMSEFKSRLADSDYRDLTWFVN